MKTSKKIIAGVSAFLLAISTSIAMTVSAVTTDETVSDGFTVCIENRGLNLVAGSTFDVTVDLKNVPETGIGGCELAVAFDSSKFELQSVVENTDLTGDAASAELEIVPDLGSTMINGDTYSCLDYNVTDGKVALLWATGLGQEYYINQDGTLVTLTFQVKEDAEDGSSSMNIEPIRTDGEVLFASVDESGTYVQEDVSIVEDADITIGAGSDDTTTTTTTTTVTTTINSGGDDTTTTTTTISGDVSTVLGDANLDGNVKVNDVQLIRQTILHLIDPFEDGSQQFINADVTKDGSIKVNDVQLIRQYILHLIDTLDTETSNS